MQPKRLFLSCMLCGSTGFYFAMICAAWLPVLPLAVLGMVSMLVFAWKLMKLNWDERFPKPGC